MQINHLTSQIIRAAIRVHRELGPGLLESVYQKCMVVELQAMGLRVDSEVVLPVAYRGEIVANDGFKIDLLVEKTIVVELKSVAEIQAVHQKQLLTYLRLPQKPLGLLINFNVPLLKDGIERIIARSLGPV